MILSTTSDVYVNNLQHNIVEHNYRMCSTALLTAMFFPISAMITVPLIISKAVPINEN